MIKLLDKPNPSPEAVKLDNSERTSLEDLFSELVPVKEEKIEKELHKAPVKHSPLRTFIREKMPPWAYSASSVLHLVSSGVLALGNFSEDTKKSLTKYVTNFTKLINSLVYTDLAYEAANKGFAFEFLGRIAEPIMNIFADLNHYHLFRAFSSALNQLHSINMPRVKEGTSMWQNFIDNLEASKQFFQEIWTSGKFSKVLFGGKEDKGHTLAFASHIQIVVGALALLNGIKRNMANRVLGIARNIAGVIADIGLLFEKDFSAKRVGIMYLCHAIGDTIKRFMPNNTQDIIDNLIMPFYNAGLYYFGLMGRRQIDGEYESHNAKPQLSASVS